MKKTIQGIILTIEILFETVTIIGGIGASFDSKITPIQGILFCSIAILWFAVTSLGFLELIDKRKWIIIPALGIKTLIFLFFAGLLGMVENGDVEYGVFFMIISMIVLTPICIYKIMHMPKKSTAISAQVNFNFNKYRFDCFRSKQHWNEAAMKEIDTKQITDKNADKIYVLASTYFAYLLVWLIKNGLVNDSCISVFGDKLKNIETETVNPAQLFMEYTNGNLFRDDLTETGKFFLDSYYYEREYKSKYNTSYETDYAEIVQNQNHLRIYHVFSWDIYHQLEKILDKRYKYYKIKEEFISETKKAPMMIQESAYIRRSLDNL